MDTNARQVIRVCVAGLFLATPVQARLAVYPMQISCASRPGEAVKTVLNLDLPYGRWAREPLTLGRLVHVG